MQGTYTYIFETNYVPREYSVAAILLLLFMVLISLVSAFNLLHFYISTFRSTCAVPNMAVLCSSLTPYFPGMLLMYFLNDFEIVRVSPIITGITFVFTFHMRCSSLLLLLLLVVVLVVAVVVVVEVMVVMVVAAAAENSENNNNKTNRSINNTIIQFHGNYKINKKKPYSNYIQTHYPKNVSWNIYRLLHRN